MLALELFKEVIIVADEDSFGLLQHQVVIKGV